MTPSVKRPRQDPVSCELCRTKKLKCNRERPCSNCQARGISCTLGNAAQPIPRTTTAIDTDLILSRLDRLEGLLLNHPGIRKSVSSTTTPSSSHDPVAKTTLTRTANDNAAITSEEQRLFSTATVDKSFLFKDVFRIQVRVCPIDEIISKSNSPVGVGSTTAADRFFWLPQKHEALTLLNDFQIDFSHHIIFLVRAKTILESVYKAVDRSEEVEASHIGLLCAIFGSTACYRGVQNKSRTLFASDEEAYDVCKIWVRHGIEALDISQQTGSGTLEDVQAAIALCFLIFNLEGFSLRARSLHSTGLTIARDIGLHKTDCPNRVRDVHESHINLEVKRRLWWHIASTDWLLAISGGPQEGCYLVQPRHMWVNKPRNITEEDLQREGPNFARPISEPTEMSYFLQRLRSAELARDTADAWPMGASDIEQIDYNCIIELDTKFEEFFKELPVFFRPDPESTRQSFHTFKKFPSMVVQKTLINLSIHMRRCKLHQPFLVRGHSDERFRYSRDACLSSAREVIEAKRRLDKEGGTLGQRQLPLNLFVVHHLFMAVIVLVMNLCFNKASSDEEEQERRDEVAGACRTLEGFETRSGLAKRFLRSLTEVLRRHKINISQADNKGTTEPPAKPESLQQYMGLITGYGPQNQLPKQLPNMGAARLMPPGMPQMDMTNIANFDPYEYPADPALLDPVAAANMEMDGLWQSYLSQGATIDAVNWDSLFSAIGNPDELPVGWNGL